LIGLANVNLVNLVNLSQPLRTRARTHMRRMMPEKVHKVREVHEAL